MFNDRNKLRQTFVDAYKKHKNNEALNSLEQLLVTVITSHPEYNNYLENPDIDKDFTTDNNPYLHLALHVSLEEQLQTNRPAGIVTIYEQLTHKARDAHQSQHLMMNAMAEVMWEAQQNNRMPDDNDYLYSLKKLVL